MRVLGTIATTRLPDAYRLLVLFVLVVFAGPTLTRAQSAREPKGDAPPDLSSAVQETAKGTKPDKAILDAAMLRDEKACKELVVNYLDEAKKKKDRKPDLLVQSELIRVLVLDYDQPEYHVQLAASYLADVDKFKSEEDVEFVWQHLEWLRLKGTEKSLADRAAAIQKKVPLRPSEGTAGITKEVLAAARKTFQAGKAIHIEYPAKKPIEFQVGNDFAINMPTIPLIYVRSPDYPPHGCRVVAYMLVSQDGGKPEPKGMHKNYEPCAFPTGMLEAIYLSIGKVEVKADTKMFIHVESLFEAKDKPGVVISNTIEIPAVPKK